jgi:hypothetical protein
MQMWIKAASEHFGRSDIRPFSEKLAPDLQQKWLGGCGRASVQSMHDKTRLLRVRITLQLPSRSGIARAGSAS